MQPTAKRAIIWAAVSSEEQARGDKHSLQYQEATAREHAAKHGMSVVNVITSDDSRTITLFETACRNPRLGYARLAEHFDRKDFDVLLYMESSRLGRKWSLISAVMEQCIDAGVLLYDCSNPPHDLNAPQTEADRMVRALQALNSQGEIDKLRTRHRFGMLGRVRNGSIANNPVWGYTVAYDAQGKQALVLDANIAAIVRDVFALYLDGHGAPRIADMLNAANLQAPTGVKWSRSSVQNVLNHVWRYAGYAELNARSPAGRPYLRARGNWQAVIDDATAERVAAEREYRASNRRAPDTPYILSGLCICATCGATMHVSHQARKYRRGYEWIAIVCRKHSPGEYVAYNHVLRFVRAMFQTLDVSQVTAADDDSAIDAMRAQIDRQQAIISTAREALERAADAYTDGTMSADSYRRQVERKQAQIAAAEAEAERLGQRIDAERQHGTRRARLVKASEVGLAMLEHPDPATANAYLRSLLRVTIQANRVQRGDWL